MVGKAIKHSQNQIDHVDVQECVSLALPNLKWLHFHFLTEEKCYKKAVVHGILQIDAIFNLK